MNSIRPYRESDKKKVQNICLANADCETESEETKEYILLMYCNYYIEQEPENTFVAVNESDEPIGYIFCSENYDKYEKVFSEIYLPQAYNLSKKRYIDAKLDMLTHSMFKKPYPAHMHIDIESGYQHMGLGTMLINRLKEHLKDKGIGSIMLVCGADNEKAIKFYIKNGFKELIVTKFGEAMAIDF